MSELAAPPTRRNEAWRYADFTALEALAPSDFARRRELAVAPGETHSECFVLDETSPGLHRLRLILGAGARAEIFAVLSAAAYTRLDVEVVLEEGAHFELGGVTIGGGDATREIVTRLAHARPGATSNQAVRSVHWGRATGNFLGAIEVARDAQKTDAAQNFRAILLEAGASANAKPELEIFADDVKCAHGAAIGTLDKAAAFYMASRGIPPDAARRLLIRAFIADAFVAVRSEEDRDAMLGKAVDVLEGFAG